MTPNPTPSDAGVGPNRAARRAAKRSASTDLAAVPSSPTRSSRGARNAPTRVQPRRTGVRGNR
jgi:hypothetical protein